MCMEQSIDSAFATVTQVAALSEMQVQDGASCNSNFDIQNAMVLTSICWVRSWTMTGCSTAALHKAQGKLGCFCLTEKLAGLSKRLAVCNKKGKVKEVDFGQNKALEYSLNISSAQQPFASTFHDVPWTTNTFFCSSFCGGVNSGLVVNTTCTWDESKSVPQNHAVPLHPEHI